MKASGMALATGPDSVVFFSERERPFSEKKATQ
jgi:hypothetical protein